MNSKLSRKLLRQHKSDGAFCARRIKEKQRESAIGIIYFNTGSADMMGVSKRGCSFRTCNLWRSHAFLLRNYRGLAKQTFLCFCASRSFGFYDVVFAFRCALTEAHSEEIKSS